MSILVRVVMVIAFAIPAPYVAGQAHLDISGGWTVVTEQSSGAASLGVAFTARESGNELIIERKSGEKTVTATYHLDGTETKNSSPTTVRSESVSTVRSQGRELRIVTRLTDPAPGQPTEFIRVISMPTPETLKIETTANPGNKLSVTVYRRTDRLAGEATALSDLDATELFSYYEKIHKALASDSMAGVSTAAATIAQLAAKDHLPAGQQIALALSTSTDLARARGQFADLSDALLPTLLRSVDGLVEVVCPMNHRKWCQRTKEVANPYYGSSMATCGTIVNRSRKN